TFVLLLGCHLTRSCRAFSFPAHYHGFCPQQREVVWNLLLQDGSEGPPLIDYSVTQKRRLSPPLLLMAHLEDELHGKLQLPWAAVAKRIAVCDIHGTRNRTERGAVHRHIRQSKIRVIENIEELSTELQARSVGDRCRF